MVPYPLNHDAFASVSRDGLYWAGFLMADGCINYPKRGRPRLCVSLGEVDIGHLEKLKTFLGASQHRLYVQADSQRGYQWRQLVVASESIVNDLAAYGVVPRKSLVAKAAPVAVDSADFWRGVVDGNGSLGAYGGVGRTGTYLNRTLALYGSFDLLEQFRDFLLRQGVPVKARVAPNYRHARFAVKSSVADLAVQVLYGDAPVALDRKMDAAKTLFQWA